MVFGGNFDKNERVVVSSTGIGAFNRVRRDSLGDTFLFSSFYRSWSFTNLDRAWSEFRQRLKFIRGPNPSATHPSVCEVCKKQFQRTRK